MSFSITGKINCEDCPWFCCYSLRRHWSGYIHPTNIVGTSCSKLCANCTCAIHETLETESPDCGDYSCFWAWKYITWLYWLPKDRKIEDSKIQERFSILQHLAIQIYSSKVRINNWKANNWSKKEIEKIMLKYEEKLKKLSTNTTSEEWENLIEESARDHGKWEILIDS